MLETLLPAVDTLLQELKPLIKQLPGANYLDGPEEDIIPLNENDLKEGTKKLLLLNFELLKNDKAKNLALEKYRNNIPLKNGQMVADITTHPYAKNALLALWNCAVLIKKTLEEPFSITNAAAYKTCVEQLNSHLKYLLGGNTLQVADELTFKIAVALSQFTAAINQNKTEIDKLFTWLKRIPLLGAYFEKRHKILNSNLSTQITLLKQKIKLYQAKLDYSWEEMKEKRRAEEIQQISALKDRSIAINNKIKKMGDFTDNLNSIKANLPQLALEIKKLQQDLTEVKEELQKKQRELEENKSIPNEIPYYYQSELELPWLKGEEDETSLLLEHAVGIKTSLQTSYQTYPDQISSIENEVTRYEKEMEYLKKCLEAVEIISHKIQTALVTEWSTTKKQLDQLVEKLRNIESAISTPLTMDRAADNTVKNRLAQAKQQIEIIEILSKQHTELYSQLDSLNIQAQALDYSQEFVSLQHDQPQKLIKAGTFLVLQPLRQTLDELKPNIEELNGVLASLKTKIDQLEMELAKNDIEAAEKKLSEYRKQQKEKLLELKRQRSAIQELTERIHAKKLKLENKIGEIAELNLHIEQARTVMDINLNQQNVILDKIAAIQQQLDNNKNSWNPLSLAKYYISIYQNTSNTELAKAQQALQELKQEHKTQACYLVKLNEMKKRIVQEQAQLESSIVVDEASLGFAKEQYRKEGIEYQQYVQEPLIQLEKRVAYLNARKNLQLLIGNTSINNAESALPNDTFQSFSLSLPDGDEEPSEFIKKTVYFLRQYQEAIKYCEKLEVSKSTVQNAINSIQTEISRLEAAMLEYRSSLNSLNSTEIQQDSSSVQTELDNSYKAVMQNKQEKLKTTNARKTSIETEIERVKTQLAVDPRLIAEQILRLLFGNLSNSLGGKAGTYLNQRAETYKLRDSMAQKLCFFSKPEKLRRKELLTNLHSRFEEIITHLKNNQIDTAKQEIGRQIKYIFDVRSNFTSRATPNQLHYEQTLQHFLDETLTALQLLGALTGPLSVIADKNIAFTNYRPPIAQLRTLIIN